MDITLVRQGSYNQELIKDKKVECITNSDISEISRSTLRILYACGQRPLYVAKGKDFEISTEKDPQVVPDCILCGKSNISYQSARILQKQLKHAGFPVKIERLSSLSETSLSEKQLKRRSFSYLIQNTFESLAKKGIRHILVVAEPNKLNAISYAMTNQDTPWNEGDFVKSIKDGKISYTYNPENVEYLTEGILNTMMMHMLNKPTCPDHLKQFSGKVTAPLNTEFLSHAFKKRYLERCKK